MPTTEPIAANTWLVSSIIHFDSSIDAFANWLINLSINKWLFVFASDSNWCIRSCITTLAIRHYALRSLQSIDLFERKPHSTSLTIRISIKSKAILLSETPETGMKWVAIPLRVISVPKRSSLSIPDLWSGCRAETALTRIGRAVRAVLRLGGTQSLRQTVGLEKCSTAPILIQWRSGKLANTMLLSVWIRRFWDADTDANAAMSQHNTPFTTTFVWSWSPVLIVVHLNWLFVCQVVSVYHCRPQSASWRQVTLRRLIMILIRNIIPVLMTTFTLLSAHYSNSSGYRLQHLHRSLYGTTVESGSEAETTVTPTELITSTANSVQNLTAIRLANEHFLLIRTQYRCRTPRPKLIKVKDYYDFPHKEYLPR